MLRILLATCCRIALDRFLDVATASRARLIDRNVVYDYDGVEFGIGISTSTERINIMLSSWWQSIMGKISQLR